MLKFDFGFLKKMNNNTILVGVAAVAIVITGVLIFAKSNNSFTFPSIFGISDSQIAKNAIDYINSNQLSQTPASLVSVSRDSGLVKIKIKIGTSSFDSYATKDGKLLFPQAFAMGGQKASATASDATTNTAKDPAEAAAAIAKTDKPMLEAYIVARCPFGLQMQRAMADAVSSVPSIAQNMKVRYMGSVSGDSITSMHGDAEAKENLRQICIREEQPAKYWSYIGCQMKASGTEVSCEKSTGVDSAKLSACVSAPSRGVAYAKEDFDLNTKYNVTGSPTLILDGSTVSEFDFGGRSSDAIKSIVCAAMKTQSSFCSTALSTTDAATSFSATYSSGGSAGNANSGANGTNCAPAQ